MNFSFKDILEWGLDWIGINQKTILIAIASLIAGIIIGWKICDWRNSAEKLEAVQTARELEQKLRDSNSEIEKLQLQIKNDLSKKSKETIKYVPKIITVKDDAACTIGYGSIRVFNDSVAGRSTSPSNIDGTASGVNLSTIISTAAENHFICRENAEQLKNLQAVIRKYQEETKAVKKIW